MLSIYGGKITTYRRLAEHAIAKLQPLLGFKPGPWTKNAALPGGDIENADFEAFFNRASGAYRWLRPADLRRLARADGTRLETVLDGATSYSDLGAQFGGGLSAREVDYLRRVEFARSADDILWRRTKLAIHLSDRERDAVSDYLNRQ